MKTISLTIIVIFLFSHKGNSQHFISDSICYYHSYTGERIRCDIPSMDPVTSTCYRDVWEVSRDGDFIAITHWDTYFMNSNRGGIGLTTYFQAESKNEEVTTFPNPGVKFKVSKQFLSGNASSTRDFNLGLDWDLYDINGDGKWDRLALTWTEANNPLTRILFCHIK